MDSLLQGTIGGVSIAAVVAAAFGLYKLLNHTRFRSTCCKHEFEVSLDIERTPKPSERVSTAEAAAALPPLEHKV
jgi:hypothetical protein